MDEIIETLNRLHAAVDNIIEKMNPADWHGAINWGDLGCAEALVGVNEDRQLIYRVVVEEAAPGEDAFCRHIEQELARRGWGNVSVSTEW
jgi:hypothetical protein